MLFYLLIFLLHITSIGFVWGREGCKLWEHAEQHFFFFCPLDVRDTDLTLLRMVGSFYAYSPPPTLNCHCIVLCVQREAAAVFTYFIGPIYQCYWMTELLFLVTNQLNALGVIAFTNRHIFFTVPASRKLVLEKTAGSKMLLMVIQLLCVCMSLCIMPEPNVWRS